MYFLKHTSKQNAPRYIFDLPIGYKHKSLPLIVPVVNSVEMDKYASCFIKHNLKPGHFLSGVVKYLKLQDEVEKKYI